MNTIVLPVSRKEYLDAVFASLEFLECDIKNTNLLVIVDGPPDVFVEARNKCEFSKFNQRLCVQFQVEDKTPRKFDLLARRKRIAAIHNQVKQYVKSASYLFLLEDDTIVPANALQRLLQWYFVYPYAAFISGIELGRHGIPHPGAWMADDVYEPTKIQSAAPKKGIEEVDAAGFYACLTKAEIYMAHDFKPFDGNSLGPDVDFGLEMRRQGYKNYVDWDIKCTHKRPGGDLSMANTTPMQVTFTKTSGRWKQQIERNQYV